MPILTPSHCADLIAVGPAYVECKSARMMHRGVLPVDFCAAQCSYRRKRDFFQQTSDLWVQQTATGEYRPKPKPCGGCGQAKRRDSAVQFVWPYWHGGASGDEIRWSVRSVETMFQGKVKITIVGDKPPWYHGHHILKPRIAKHTPNRAYRDMLSKMWVMATHEEIDDEFVWMMDDIYLIKPVSLEDLEVPRADKWYGSRGNSWQRRKFNTMTILQSCNLSTHDYATHMPHVVEKTKLRQMYEKHDLHTNTVLWEVLYGNTYRSNPAPPRPFFARVNKRMTRAEYEVRTKNAVVLNHTASAWCVGVREFLESILPTPSKTEQESVVYVPQYRKSRGIQRQVKRRPR